MHMIHIICQFEKLIYKKSVEPSTRKNKKYMIMNDDHNYIHVGDLRYEDYTKHQDLKRLNNYLSRATKIKGNWKKRQIFTEQFSDKSFME